MFNIACIVEGHGEVSSLPVLIRRVLSEKKPGFNFQVIRPIRCHRSQILKDPELGRALGLAALHVGAAGAILILFDSDDDCPRDLGPQTLKRAQDLRNDQIIKVVLPKREFESWFLAAATSLAGKKGLPANLTVPDNSEDIRGAKEWLKAQGIPYSETVDQPAFSAIFDIGEAEANSDSFRKFTRDIVAMVEPHINP